MPGYMVISRPNALTGRAVGHRIWINGQQVGTVRNNTSTGFTLPPGQYQVRTSSGGSRSQELSVTVVENTQTLLWSEPNGAVTAVSTVIGGVVGVGAVAMDSSFALIIAIAAVFLVITLVIGRLLPGTFLQLRAAASGPVMPWPYQVPPGPMPGPAESPAAQV